MLLQKKGSRKNDVSAWQAVRMKSRDQGGGRHVKHQTPYKVRCLQACISFIIYFAIVTGKAYSSYLVLPRELYLGNAGGEEAEVKAAALMR